MIEKYFGLNIFFERGHNGFGWVFEGQTKLALGAGGLSKDNKLRVKSLVDEISELPKSGSGWLVPYGELPRVRCTEDIFLIGDAAGYTDPILGEGLSYALTAGKKIVKVIQAEDKVREYNLQFHKEVQTVKYGKFFQWIFFNPLLQSLFVKIMKAQPEKAIKLCDDFVFKKILEYKDAWKVIINYFTNR